MDEKKKWKKKKAENQQYEFCEVCRLNHNQGRRHRYFPNHKASLSTLLACFQTKLSDIKFFLKTPMLLRPEHAHQNRLWCVFCSCDILELDSSFACGNAIEHLASGEHWNRVKGFMWKYGGEVDRADSFRISDLDFVKWEKRCKSLMTEGAKGESGGSVLLPLNDIRNELNADNVNNSNKHNHFLNFNIANGVVPLQSYTNESPQISCSALSSISDAASYLYHMTGGSHVGDAICLRKSIGPLASEGSSCAYLSNGSVTSGERKANEESGFLGLQNLSKISSTYEVPIEGNVHTGAPPPWLDAAARYQNDDLRKPELGDIFTSKAGKSSKLNPKRVGAAWAERRKLELELERRGEILNNNYDANWLPNFGRVWQSGTRKESRKEFQIEYKAPIEVDNQSERPMQLQPYISKRTRGETSG